MLSYPRSWRNAWAESAYSGDGFWRAERPGAHFRTAVSSSPIIAQALAELLAEHPQITSVIDIGAGAGHLLRDLAELCPAMGLTAIDVARRPAALSRDLRWHVDFWDVDTNSWTTGAAEIAYANLAGPALMVMSEWLDDLPCTLAVRSPGRDDRHSELLVDLAGAEWPGSAVTTDEQAWVDRWWPAGDRIEIGLSRDRAWAAALAALPYGGLGLLIDYGHVRSDRPEAGTLAAYRGGRRVSPIPSTTLNLTAHVAVDAIEAAGCALGAKTVLFRRQRDVLGDRAQGASAGLDQLVRRSQRHALTDPHIWGSQWWLLQSVVAP
jgi:SAM-dependent MidA family methyltransferase